MDKYGYLRDELEPDHYVFGGYSGIAERPSILPGGNWEPHLSVAEYQSTKSGKLFDSRNCTAHGTLNCLESIAKLHGFNDFPSNCSERYTGVCAGTTQNGNSPHRVIESVRSAYGVIPEEVLPLSDDIHSAEDYYHPNPMTADFVRLGESILQKFTINHEWVFNGLKESDKQAKLMEALEKGAVGVSVLAWSKDKKTKLYRKSRGAKDNHWVQLVSYKKGKSWRIFDSYDTTLKDLEWDYNFEVAKIYYIARGGASVKVSMLEELLAKLKELLALYLVKPISGLWKA